MMRIAAFPRDRAGSTAIEYALIAALVGVALIAGGAAFGQAVNAKFQFVAGSVAQAH